LTILFEDKEHVRIYQKEEEDNDLYSQSDVERWLQTNAWLCGALRASTHITWNIAIIRNLSSLRGKTKKPLLSSFPFGAHAFARPVG